MKAAGRSGGATARTAEFHLMGRSTMNRPNPTGARGARRTRRAFSMVDTLMTVVVIGVMATIALTSAAGVDSTQLCVASAQLAAMVEYGQSLAIARTDLGVVLKANLDRQVVWLASASAPDTPLNHPVTREPFVIRFGAAATGALSSILLETIAFDGTDTISFDSTGGLNTENDAMFQLRVRGTDASVMSVALTPTSGRVRIVADRTISQIASDEGRARAEAAADIAASESDRDRAVDASTRSAALK
jgi:Tfp pilus assembly protein FimT